jgi:hypothetical protein
MLHNAVNQYVGFANLTMLDATYNSFSRIAHVNMCAATIRCKEHRLKKRHLLSNIGDGGWVMRDE